LELIAPEKVDDLAQYFDEITLEVVVDSRWLCRIEPTSGLITVSYRAVEILWAVSYAYWTFYAKVVNGRMPCGQEVDLSEDPELAAAMSLLRWGIAADGASEPWPVQTPSPLLSPSPGSLEYAAQQLCLGAAGLLLHHELAHKRLRHPGSNGSDKSWTLEAEKDADNFAADWILDQSTCPADKREFRAISASVALLMATAFFGIHRGEYGGLTHPRVFDRLFNSLSRHLEPDNDGVWSFVGSVLLLHMQSMGIQLPPKRYDSHFDFVNACVDRLAQEAEQWNPA
jgi:hypothetical protein